MQLFKENGVSGLADSEPTIKLIRIISNLIKAMMSRTATDALRQNEDCPMKKVLHFESIKNVVFS